MKEDEEKKEDEKSEDQEKGKSSTDKDGDGKECEKDKKRDYMREELKRLETGFKRETSKIRAPPIREHYPYVFTNLAPYTNVHTAKYLIYLPDELRHGYVNRQTAVGLCDPWIDHGMDVTVLPKIESKAVPQSPRESPRNKKKNDKDRPPKEGSTRLPKYPTVSVPAGDLSTRTLFYNDVPLLREELRKKYSTEAQEKINEDYKRTKQDFYRMELDRMDQVHPINRRHMRKTYFAYLQNTPGSRKAVTECVKMVEKKMAAAEKSK